MNGMAIKATKSQLPSDIQSLLAKLHRGSKYYSDLAKITAGLLIAILALMTFLMLAGLQRPAANFELQLYLSIVTLGLSLSLYVLGNILNEQMLTTTETTDKSRRENAFMKLRAARFIQQLVFVLSVVFVVWFAVMVARIFFAPSAVPQSLPQSTEQPAEQPSSQPNPESAP